MKFIYILHLFLKALLKYMKKESSFDRYMDAGGASCTFIAKGYGRYYITGTTLFFPHK